MDKRSRLLLLTLLLLIIAAVSFMYYKIFILHDYLVQSEIDCDPYTEQCFVYKCDILVDECTGDPDQDIYYYKIIRRFAGSAPVCADAEEDCIEKVSMCGEGEKWCEYEYCSDFENESCINPEDFALSHARQPDDEETEESNQMSDETANSESEAATEGDIVLELERQD